MHTNVCTHVHIMRRSEYRTWLINAHICMCFSTHMWAHSQNAVLILWVLCLLTYSQKWHVNTQLNRNQRELNIHSLTFESHLKRITCKHPSWCWRYKNQGKRTLLLCQWCASCWASAGPGHTVPDRQRHCCLPLSVHLLYHQACKTAHKHESQQQ